MARTASEANAKGAFPPSYGGGGVGRRSSTVEKDKSTCSKNLLGPSPPVVSCSALQEAHATKTYSSVSASSLLERHHLFLQRVSIILEMSRSCECFQA